jgi:hypothetical protein
MGSSPRNRCCGIRWSSRRASCAGRRRRIPDPPGQLPGQSSHHDRRHRRPDHRRHLRPNPDPTLPAWPSQSIAPIPPPRPHPPRDLRPVRPGSSHLLVRRLPPTPLQPRRRWSLQPDRTTPKRRLGLCHSRSEGNLSMSAPALIAVLPLLVLTAAAILVLLATSIRGTPGNLHPPQPHSQLLHNRRWPGPGLRPSRASPPPPSSSASPSCTWVSVPCPSRQSPIPRPQAQPCPRRPSSPASP